MPFTQIIPTALAVVDPENDGSSGAGWNIGENGLPKLPITSVLAVVGVGAVILEAASHAPVFNIFMPRVLQVRVVGRGVGGWGEGGWEGGAAVGVGYVDVMLVILKATIACKVQSRFSSFSVVTIGSRSVTRRHHPLISQSLDVSDLATPIHLVPPVCTASCAQVAGWLAVAGYLLDKRAAASSSS